MDTSDVCEKLNNMWKAFDAGKVSANEARVHIGFARAILDTKKVEIAAAHLNMAAIPAVPLTNGSRKLPGSRARQ